MEFDKFFLDAVLRWGHIMAGIIWIGHLYFFNFVNGAMQAKLDGETKKKVNPQLMWRTLFWFRWGAMFTLILGLCLFVNHWWFIKDYKNVVTGELSGRALWIMIGMTMGIVMWFNVWFIIWPAQQKIVPAVAKGEKPPEGLPARAALFSRINTYLSGPMLFCMVFGAHATQKFNAVLFALLLVVGLAAIHLFIKSGPKVGVWQD